MPGSCKSRAISTSRKTATFSGSKYLEAVEHQLLPQLAAIVLGQAPFLVVVRSEKGVGLRPGTTMDNVGIPGRHRNIDLLPSGGLRRQFLDATRRAGIR